MQPSSKMKSPEACTGLDDIRQALDRIDQDIIEALGLRLHYVKAAAAFKPDEASIPAPERVAAMLPVRRQWAEAAGLDGAFVQSQFARIVDWYIQQQIIHWRATRGIA
jgi:isochorismate pyruvate lyase